MTPKGSALVHMKVCELGNLILARLLLESSVKHNSKLTYFLWQLKEDFEALFLSTREIFFIQKFDGQI